MSMIPFHFVAFWFLLIIWVSVVREYLNETAVIDDLVAGIAMSVVALAFSYVLLPWAVKLALNYAATELFTGVTVVAAAVGLSYPVAWLLWRKQR